MNMNENQYRRHQCRRHQCRSFGSVKSDENMRVSGYACTFEQPYLVSVKKNGDKIYEIISKSAFDNSDLSDVVMLYDHEGKILARNSGGSESLKLEVDDVGLKFTADLSLSAAGRELYEEIKNGLVTKMSFAFEVVEQVFEKHTSTVVVFKIGKVYDVSAVSFPANENTEVEARKRNGVDNFYEECFKRDLLKLKLKLLLNGGVL